MMSALVFTAISIAGVSLPAISPSALAQGSPAISVSDGEGGARAGTASDILARAESRGLLEVIVGVDATVNTHRELSATEEAEEAAAISSAQEAVLSRISGAQNVHRFTTVPYISMLVTPDQLRTLLETPGVTSVTEDIPADPMLAESVKVINANKLWKKKKITGKGQIVAVLDTGAQLGHPAFKKQIRGGACFSTPVSGIAESLCKNGQAVDTRTKSAKACGLKGCDHGTHVSGIAMGFAGKNKIKGVAPYAKLVIVQVFRKYIRDSDCAPKSAPCIRSSSTDSMKALEWIYTKRDKGIDVVNMSLGGGRYYSACDSDPRRASIDKLRAAGIATVVASGNNSYPDSISAPACVSSAIAVGNTKKDDKIWRSSNHSPLIDLMAPGTKIKAPIPGSKYGVKTGTSMAAPHVAGAWALLREAKKRATVDETLRALACTGKEVKRNDIAKPRIDVLRAFKVLKRGNQTQAWNFKSLNQVEDWEDEIGKWTKSGDNLYVHGGGPTIWLAATSPFCAASIVVAAKVKRIDRDDFYSWNSGLFLYSRIDNKKNMSGMWFAYNKYDDGEDDDKGQAVIWRVSHQNGINNSGGANVLLCEADDVQVNEQDYNILKVKSVSGVHKFYLNGTLVCSATDSTFKAGDLAMVMAGPGSDSSHKYYVKAVKARQLAAAEAQVASASDSPALDVPANVSPLGVSTGLGAIAAAGEAD